MVFEDLMITVSPSWRIITSDLARVCGPDHKVAVGDNKFDALRNEKYPRHRAAFTGDEWGMVSRYMHRRFKSCGVSTGAGEGVCGFIMRPPLYTATASVEDRAESSPPLACNHFLAPVM